MAQHSAEWPSDEALVNLRQYTYAAAPSTALDQMISAKWWQLLVDRLVPQWVAPNALTLGGFLCSLAAFCVCGWFSPDYQQPLPPAACFATALLLFGHQTLDGMDGKQARKTGSSSALGQIFDHGCDAFSTVLWGCCAVAALRMGPSFWAVGLLTAEQLLLFVYAWLELHFHVFKCHTGYLGVTEGQVSIISGILFVGMLNFLGFQDLFVTPVTRLVGDTLGWWLAALAGPWRTQAFTVLSGVPAGSVLVGFWVFIIAASAAYDVVDALLRMEGWRRRGHAAQQIAAMLLHLVAQACFYASDFGQRHPLWVSIVVTINTGIWITRLHLCSVCRIRFAALHEPLLPFYVVAFAAYCGAPHPAVLAAAVTAWSTVHAATFVPRTVNRICATLEIRCFSLAKGKSQ